jgi:hypothetical protein
MDGLKEVFRDKIIYSNLWPPHSTDLKPYEFYLWGTKRLLDQTLT